MKTKQCDEDKRDPWCTLLTAGGGVVEARNSHGQLLAAFALKDVRGVGTTGKSRTFWVVIAGTGHLSFFADWRDGAEDFVARCVTFLQSVVQIHAGGGDAGALQCHLVLTPVGRAAEASDGS